MFMLTIMAASVEIVFGIQANSNALIADGLYSFAEGLCLIGVMLVLHYSHNSPNQHKHNTFGYERLELLFGLIQEVFLLSISLGVIVDAINHLIHPTHIHNPILLIIIGVSGIFIGILGIVMFWGYHHNHDIKGEIDEKLKRDFLSFTKRNLKRAQRSSVIVNPNTAVETPLMIEKSKDQSSNEAHVYINTKNIPENTDETASNLDGFTYEHVEIKESRVYATLHALCLHSFVVLLESIIVVISGLMVLFIPHIDPITGKEINIWLKYVDPILTLLMVIVVAIHTVPVIFSISKMLIENVPDGIDTNKLMKEIVTTIPAIKSIHSFHVWRATAREIYASMHLVCDEDVMLSKCTHEYGMEIQKIFKSYCIRYFTLQFEYATSHRTDELRIYNCTYGLYRKRRGHTLDENISKLAKDAIAHIH